MQVFQQCSTKTTKALPRKERDHNSRDTKIHNKRTFFLFVMRSNKILEMAHARKPLR